MEPIYLDHAATTALRPEVRESMLPYLDARFGNPSSLHRWGRQARNALEEARARLAGVLGARRREIVFTGGGTEANNIAILGSWRARGQAGHAIVTSAIEHKAVGAAVQRACAEGAGAIVLGVDAQGRVDPASVDEALRTTTCLVSVMWGNNEVGTLQPVAAIAERCSAAKVPFHTDAVQAVGKMRIRVDEVPCDMLSLSAHKIGGPKGCGALYLRDGVAVQPLTHGGGQERELRPGTENVAGAVGLAVAAELAAHEVETESVRLRGLRDRLETEILAQVPDAVIHAGSAERLPHILSIALPFADAEALLIGLDLEGVAASGASACQSGNSAPSHVLVAMGATAPDRAVVRFSLGHTTTAPEIDRAAAIFARVAARVRIRQPA